MPRPEVVAVVPLGGISGGSSEVLVVTCRPGRHVLVVSGDGSRNRFQPPQDESYEFRNFV